MRVLPADVYDTLEFSALAFDGIGRGPYVRWEQDNEQPCPNCIHGHAWSSEGIALPVSLGGTGELSTALLEVSLYGLTSDLAVRRIQQRNGLAPDDRVPFSEWCAELGVVRGE